MIRKVLLTAISAVALVVLGAPGGVEADSGAVSTKSLPEVSIASPPRAQAPARVLTASSNDNPGMALGPAAIGAGVLVVTLAVLTRRSGRLVVVPATVGIDAPTRAGVGTTRPRQPEGEDDREPTPLGVPGASGSGLGATD